MNQQNLQTNFRYPGKYSIDGNKLRIQNQLGMTSVLFEDISSVSYKSISQPKPIYILIGLLISFPLYIMGGSNNNISLTVLGLVVCIGSIIYTYKNKVKWDNVIVESRGGLLLIYSVEFGDGISEVDKIENDRRKMSNVK